MDWSNLTSPFCPSFCLFIRYGEIFKTHILGCPCVMLASPEATKFVLVTHAHLFKPTYPKSKEKMIGPSALFFHQGDYHSSLKKLIQSSLSPNPNTMQKLVPDIEALAISTLESWAVGGKVVNSYHEMKNVRARSIIISFFYSKLFWTNMLVKLIILATFSKLFFFTPTCFWCINLSPCLG